MATMSPLRRRMFEDMRSATSSRRPNNPTSTRLPNSAAISAAHRIGSTFKIVQELDELRVIRHDAVHGVALERLSPTARKVLRLDHDGKELKLDTKTYGLVDLTPALNDMVFLKNDLYALFRDVTLILHPNEAKQAYS